MTRVFHLVPSLGPTAAGRQLALLAPGLAAAGVEQVVGVLGDTVPFGAVLTAAGLDVRRVPVRHPFDLTGANALLRAVRDSRPDVLHPWGPAAARVWGVVKWGTRVRPRVVRERVPPVSGPATPPPEGFRKSLGIPLTARLIVAAGGFDPTADLKAAVWAFDVLKFAAPDVRLVVLGSGPERATVERFARRLGDGDDRVHFAGPGPDPSGVIGLATLAWVTHRRGGTQFALEAMTAGVPVVGFATPDLAATVGDAGRLVPPGDKVKLAAVTLDLLDHPGERDRLAAAGGAAAARFSPGPVVERLAAVYHDRTAAGR